MPLKGIINFYETVMGKHFFEGTAPKIARELESLTAEIKTQNELKERELRLKEKELELKEREIALEKVAVGFQTARQNAAIGESNEHNERISIKLNDGHYLVAEHNSDPAFNSEIYIGLEDERGCFVQDLAIVRQAYALDGPLDGANYIPEKYEVLVFGDSDDDDYTDKFEIGLRKDEEDD